MSRPLDKLPDFLKFPLRGLMLLTIVLLTVGILFGLGYLVAASLVFVFGLLTKPVALVLVAIALAYFILYWLGSD